jgi:hypothetical protein
MVADSYAVNGDVELAKRRLSELTDDDTSWGQVADLVAQKIADEEAEGKAASVVRVRQLESATGLSEVPAEPYEPPTRQVSSAPRWVLLLMAAAAFVIALAMVVWVLLRLLRSPAADRSAYGQVTAGSPSRETGLGPGRREWTESEPSIPDTGLDAAPPPPPPAPHPRPGRPSPASPPPAGEDAAGPERSDSWDQGASGRREAPPSFLSPVGRHGAREAPRVPRGALAAFEAEYQFGDDDFDCSFSIETADGEFLGECGVSVSDILEGDDMQHVDAFEVWLFDKEDIRTVSSILVSEFAYADDVLNAELSAKGELLVAQPGSTITLETMFLQLAATIEDHAYLPDEEIPDGIFSSLNVTLVVRQVD